VDAAWVRARILELIGPSGPTPFAGGDMPQALWIAERAIEHARQRG